MALLAFLVLYAISPLWLGVLALQLPAWVRWTGIALACASFVLYGWAQATLGRTWSPHLQMRDQHVLVTTGPYACMRHPIYAAYIAFMSGIMLVTANWFFVGLLLLSLVIFALRIPKEEQMLLEAFEDQYRTYMQKTGSLFPK